MKGNIDENRKYNTILCQECKRNAMFNTKTENLNWDKYIACKLEETNLKANKP